MKWIFGLMAVALFSCSGHVDLMGKHNQHADQCALDDFYAHAEEEFVPFADTDLYHGIMRGDEIALAKIDADTAIPASRAESSIPGVDKFKDAKQFETVHFITDDYAIRGSANVNTVKTIASYLKKHPNTYLYVEGHCDERGAAAYNLALGTRRAHAVRNALIKDGVDPDRILTISYGKERPIAKGHDAEAWKINRRAQFRTYERK